MKYGEPQTVTIHVNKNEKNVYSISQEDLAQIDGNVMAMDVLQ